MVSQILAARYQVQRQLGKNAGRRTLLARDLETQAMVVIKLLSLGSDFEWADLKLFEREAETLRSLSHIAIPRYLDYFELNSPEYKGFALVQTYEDGQSLEQQLKAGRTFSEIEVRQIAKALLEILTYLHGRQPPLIHRDIKPSNVLLANRSGNSVGQVYLVDFGSVKTLTPSEGSTFTVVGTYGYMPPEQFGGRTVAGSDLYSLGATLIALATGTHPADLPQQELRIQFEQVANLSSTFSSWLRRLVEPSLERRMTSAQVALQALENLQTDSALEITKPSGSRLSLTKTVDSLEIIAPPVEFNGAIDTASAYAVFLTIFLTVWTVGVVFIPHPMHFLFPLFSLPHWIFNINMILKIIFALHGRVRLRLDHQQILKTYELFRFTYSCSPIVRQDINKLVHSPKHFKTKLSGERIEVPPQLTIQAGVRKCIIGGSITPVMYVGGKQIPRGSRFSDQEIAWLAQELSDWLGLPVTKV